MADETETTETPAVAEESLVIYNSQPILNLSVGEYQFVNGVLKLTEAEAVTFDALLDSMPLIERNRIAKIDVAAANALISAIVPQATQNPDSSAGRAALLKLQEQSPKHGTEPVDTPKGDSAAKA
jgi:hypothetical protein